LEEVAAKTPPNIAINFAIPCGFDLEVKQVSIVGYFGGTMKISQSMTIEIVDGALASDGGGRLRVSTHRDGGSFIELSSVNFKGQEEESITLSLEQANAVAGALVKVCKHILEEEAKG
jgi:hypothetical protein